MVTSLSSLYRDFGSHTVDCTAIVTNDLWAGTGLKKFTQFCYAYLFSCLLG